MQLTSDQYLQAFGLVCPVCGNTEMNAGPSQYSSINIYVEVFCKVCESSWTDEYKMTGFGNLISTREDNHE